VRGGERAECEGGGMREGEGEREGERERVGRRGLAAGWGGWGQGVRLQ
jgi:hypothetical protein